MGGVVEAIFGGGQSSPKAPEVPDYEGERRKAEEAAQKKRAALADKGMSGAILGGSAGDETGVKKKKLLGE
jgi:hypothetical protein